MFNIIILTNSTFGEVDFKKFIILYFTCSRESFIP